MRTVLNEKLFECATDGCCGTTYSWHCDDCTNRTFEDAHTIRYGYNLADINRLARIAVTRARTRSGSWADRVALAWSGIAEALCVADAAPAPEDLIRAGWNAVLSNTLQEMRTHGVPTDSTMTGGRFEAFWGFINYAPSPESRVVDRMTLWQIWPSLTRRQQQALTTLAACEDQDLAAQAMGTTPSNFRVLLSQARTQFFACWHDGETPSGLWRLDRRKFRRDGLDRFGKPRVTVSQLEAIRARHHAGETLSAIGVDYGVKKACLSSLLTGRTKPQPDGGES